MQLGIGLTVVGVRAPRYDPDDLASGTLSLDFTAVNDLTLSLELAGGFYRGWVDDPAWPYGVVGVFKGKA
ncbi:hypothetical protein K2O51_23295 [Cupriavidus pinatubonensis]|uniref:hypothetical protein n=1 Tax=Cupriavidus pinatubonensis TaxID=248026 RepID=UPI001C738BDB|nr:hypothetical protein [Cupriavidus pinatubonensis]QYY30298.1 hypothetical protein K2O51_23295 [Cupriavidus pinatubonensis]